MSDARYLLMATYQATRFKTGKTVKPDNEKTKTRSIVNRSELKRIKRIEHHTGKAGRGENRELKGAHTSDSLLFSELPPVLTATATGSIVSFFVIISNAAIIAGTWKGCVI